MKNNLNLKLKLDLTTINKTSNQSYLQSSQQKYCVTTRNLKDPHSMCLDYTFRNLKTQTANDFISGIRTAREDKMIIFKNKIIKEITPEINDYMEDLNKTWRLNIDFILNYVISCSESLKVNSNPEELLSWKDKESEIVNQIKLIIGLFNKKQKQITESVNLRAKVLLAKQIDEEHKRIYNENASVFLDQLAELEESAIKKESINNQNEKKFDEVEIYIQKQCLSEEKYFKYKAFKILGFLRLNTDIAYRKHCLKQFILNKLSEIKSLSQDNTSFSKPLPVKHKHKKTESLITTSNNIKQINPSKLDKINSMLEVRIKYFLSLNEYKRNLIDTLQTKQRLIAESNHKLKILICQSKILTTKNSLHKEIDFKNYNLVSSLTDDQQLSRKDSLFIRNKVSIALDTDNRIKQLNNQIISLDNNYAGVNETLDNNIYASLYPTNKRQESLVFDESVYNTTMKKSDYNQCNWDVSVINTNID